MTRKKTGLPELESTRTLVLHDAPKRVLSRLRLAHPGACFARTSSLRGTPHTFLRRFERIILHPTCDAALAARIAAARAYACGFDDAAEGHTSTAAPYARVLVCDAEGKHTEEV